MENKLVASIFLIDGRVAHFSIRENGYKTVDDALRERLQKGIINCLLKRQYKTIKVEWREQKTESREEFREYSMLWIKKHLFHPLYLKVESGNSCQEQS